MRPTTIYLADDHSLFCNALKDLLETQGLTVVGHALDGEAALKGIGELTPDVVVLDIGMPRMNGLTLTKHIKAAFPQIKVIILTMNTDAGTVVEALSLGADGYISKQSAATSLLEAVKTVIDGRQYIGPEFDGLLVNKTLSTEDLTLEDILDRALAEIVGGFCHDIGNDLETCLLLLKERKYVRAQKVGAEASASLRGLHAFVRQFYTGAGFNTSNVGGSSVESVVRGICSHVLRDKNIAVHVKTTGFEAGSVPSLMLRHLITPLVHNAAEAIELAGHKNGCLWFTLSVSSAGHLIRILVEDNGIGWKGRHGLIEKALKEGQSVSTKGSARGFGLQNIWRLVSRIGGDIRLTDRDGGGARVEILFEMRRAPRETFKNEEMAREEIPGELKQKRFNLTLRQKEVLQLLAEGRSMKEVAFILNVSPRTVAFHKYTIMEHLKMRTIPELIRYAIENSIVTDDRVRE